ncbi:unnamed protein product [Dicrocoelium dendriticum]|nr:unnamed protein product [Dicrocoelium dendriticum]
MAGYNTEKAPNVRVTLLEDPNNSLQELFNPVSQRQQVPLNQRKLPKSFFVPPTGFNNPTCLREFPSTDLVISHSKANSSPACLGAPLYTSVEPNIPNHAHQKSLDIAADFIHGYSHNIDVNDLAAEGFMYGSRPVLNYAVSELPSGYEMTLNENNQVYFLNHRTKETTWFDPRIPEAQQKWGMTLEELQQLHLSYAGQLRGNAAIFRPQLDQTCSVAVTTPSTGVTVPSTMSGVRCPQSPPSQSHPVAVMCTTDSSSATPPPRSAPPGGSVSRLRLSSQANVTAHLMHSTKRQHVQHSMRGQLEQNILPETQQRLQNNTVPTQNTSNLLGTHLRSCSQPVSMSVGRDGVLNSAVLNSSRLGNQTHMSSVGGTVCGISASSSLIGLAAASTPGGPIGSQLALQSAHLGSTTTSSSSGQLVQGLECLRLNTSTGSVSALVTPPHMAEPQTAPQSQAQQALQAARLQSQHPQYMVALNSINPSAVSGNVRFSGTSLSAVTIPASQHSHQGSMDSGVGQSLAGQSSASANQTPEHTVMHFCDTGLNECSSEHMEGIAYPNEEIGNAPLTMFDNIDISDLST